MQQAMIEIAMVDEDVIPTQVSQTTMVSKVLKLHVFVVSDVVR